MADIELYQLADAGVVDGGDFLHISQSAADYKITITELSGLFGGLSIVDLPEVISIANTYYIPVSTTGTDAGNRKASAQAFAQYVQESQHFEPALPSISLIDNVIAREDGSDELRNVVVSDLQETVLDPTSLPPITDPEASDLLIVHDQSEGITKRITKANLGTSILPVTRGLTSGGTLSNNSLNDDSLDITPLMWSDSTETVYLSTPNSFGKDVQSTWIAGGTPASPAGARPPSVALNAGEIYYVFTIGGDSVATDIGIDNVENAANLLSYAGVNYTYYRYIGAFLWLGGGRICPFNQVEDVFTLGEPWEIYSGVTIAGARQPVTAKCPPNTIAKLTTQLCYFETPETYGGGDVYLAITSPNTPDYLPVQAKRTLFAWTGR